MASDAELLTIAIILVTGFITYKGFTDSIFFDTYKFKVEPILLGKEYHRMLTSGFLHADWWHLAFNMYALYVFGDGIAHGYGGLGALLIIYFVSMVGGSLISLFINRNNSQYSSIGASGGVSGVVMAYSIMFPKATLLLFFVLPVWAWLLGIAFILVSIYGIKNKFGNIGHSAHLGGALVGILLGILFRPSLLTQNLWVIVLFLVPIAIFFYLVVNRPEFLILPSKFSLKMPGSRPSFKPRKKQPPGKVRDLTSSPKKGVSKEEELNQLLDKVQQKGYESLSTKEKTRLEKLSGEID